MPVDIEIWPTSVVFEPGERLVLEVASEDDPRMEPFLHNDPIDRKRRGITTIHARSGYRLLSAHAADPAALSCSGGAFKSRESLMILDGTIGPC